MGKECNESIIPGKIIMSGLAVSSNSVSIQIKRNGVNLNNGDNYIPGENLTISLSNKSITSYLFDLKNGGMFIDLKKASSFIGCEKKRTISITSLLTLPITGIVTIDLVWRPLNTYGIVNIASKQFVLNYKKEIDVPIPIILLPNTTTLLPSPSDKESWTYDNTKKGTKRKLLTQLLKIWNYFMIFLFTYYDKYVVII